MEGWRAGTGARGAVWALGAPSGCSKAFLLPPGPWHTAHPGAGPRQAGRGRLHREEGSGLRRQLTFAAGHAFLLHGPSHEQSGPRPRSPSRHVRLHTDKVCLRTFPHPYVPGIKGAAAGLSMFSHKVLGAFLPVGLPGSGPPTGPSRWLRRLLPSASSHVPNREVSRLGGPLEASNAGGGELRRMSQVWVPRAVGQQTQWGPCQGVCSSCPRKASLLVSCTTSHWHLSASGTLSANEGRARILCTLPRHPAWGQE